MTLVSDVRTTDYWRDKFFYLTYVKLSDFNKPSTTTLIFHADVPYIALPAVLLSVYRVDDLGTDYAARDERAEEAGLALLDWFLTEEQNIVVVNNFYDRVGHLHPSLSQEDQIAATRAAPVPSAVPLGYSLFGIDAWRQQYVTEDRYFGGM
jgi:hypothetical protein